MASRKGGLTVDVKGLGDLSRLPFQIEKARRAYRLTVAEGLVLSIRKNIRSRSGRLSASWRATLTPGGAKLGSSGVEYAKASVGGAYLQPKKGRKALKLANGKFVRWVRLNPGAYIGRPDDRKTSYVHLALQQFGAIAKAAGKVHFGDLKR